MDAKLAKAVTEMMKIEKPVNYEELKTKQKIRWQLKAMLAYKTMKDYATGKTEREYNKKFREHYKEILRLVPDNKN